MFMAKPNFVVGIPSGLLYLKDLDFVFIDQKIDFLEIVFYEQKNRYKVENNQNEIIYFVAEESKGFQRLLCPSKRAFKIFIYEKDKKEVLRIDRSFISFRGSSCCLDLPCFKYYAQVTLLEGQKTLGHVRMSKYCLFPKYEISDKDKNPIYYIKEYFTKHFCFRTPYKILTTDGKTKVGSLQKEWSGFFKEIFTDKTNFTLIFEQSLPVETKALLLASVFIVDFEEFEGS